MTEWQPIETAPKDGTRIMLWRGFIEFGQWSEMVIAQWYGGEWCWPDRNPSTHGEWTEDDILDGDCSTDDKFTHWMPLPPPPNQP